jgi:hypothetical protein
MARLKPYCASIPIKAQEVKHNTITVTLPSAARRAYRELEKEFFVELDGKDIFAASSLALSGKIRQLTGGAIYTQADEWTEIHEAKMDALEDLVEELEGAPLMVFYEFRHELQRLQKRFPGIKGLSLTTQREWNAGNISLLALHPKSGGHGLNLQHGGADLCFFSPPWSLELWTQCIGRLARPGQKQTVVVHSLIANDTIDERVRDQLMNHATVETSVMDSAFN